MSEPVTVKKGSEIELKIESLAFGGMGLAKLDDFVIFVKNGIPGQHVNAFVYKKKNTGKINYEIRKNKFEKLGKKHLWKKMG